MSGGERRLGILGGTFDPPHLGHLVVAEQAHAQIALDLVCFVPTGQPWMKAERRITAAHHRVEMTRLAVEGNPAFRVSEAEVHRQGPTYTLDTLLALRSAEPDSHLFLLLGEDAAASFHRWHEPQAVLDLCTLVVYRRPGGDPFSSMALEALCPGASRRVLFVDGPLIGVSATDLRRRAAAGQSLRYLVSPAVEEYINTHGLYRKEGDSG